MRNKRSNIQYQFHKCGSDKEVANHIYSRQEEHKTNMQQPTHTTDKHKVCPISAIKLD